VQYLSILKLLPTFLSKSRKQRVEEEIDAEYLISNSNKKGIAALTIQPLISSELKS